MQILSHNHTKPLSEKYAKVVLKVATLEERIKIMMSLGMVGKAKELTDTLVGLLKAIRAEFIKDEEDNENK